MPAEENEALRSPAPSSTWSGPSSGARSIETFDSEIDSNPMWREPVERLRWWKLRVAHEMSTLRQHGKEGMDVIKRQELRARGRFTDLVMTDGSQPPDDLCFWKACHEYFAQEWRQIQSRKPGGFVSVRDSVNPCYAWIQNWISDTRAAGGAGQPDAAREAVCKLQSSELSAATLRRSIVAKEQPRDGADRADQGDTLPLTPPRHDLVTKKRPRDTADGGDEGDTLPSKRSKREPPDHAKMKSQVTAAKRNSNKATASVAVAQNRTRGGVASCRDEAQLKRRRTVREPIRRSLRIAAVAKAGYSR